MIEAKNKTYIELTIEKWIQDAEGNGNGLTPMDTRGLTRKIASLARQKLMLKFGI